MSAASGERAADRRGLVSVVVPAHNCAAYLAEAIDSALSQDYAAKEIIVVDDGSTDATASVLAGFGDRIRVLQQPNSGAAVARNRGLAEAHGEFIAFLDGDDVWLPRKLSHQIAHLRSNREVGLVFSRWHRWHAGPDGRYVRPDLPAVDCGPVGIVVDESGWIYHRLLLDCWVWTSTVVMRSSLARSVGTFDAALLRGQDYDYWLRVSRLAPIHKLDATLALYRLHGASVSARPKSTNFEAIVVGRAIARWGVTSPNGAGLRPRIVRERRAQIELRFAWAHYERGDPAIALRAFLRCVRLRPFWLPGWTGAARAAARWLSKPRRSFA